jgi:hypothetical protein
LFFRPRLAVEYAISDQNEEESEQQQLRSIRTQRPPFVSEDSQEHEKVYGLR